MASQQGNEDEDALLAVNQDSDASSNNESDELRREFKRRSHDACPGLDCCGNDCSFHCATTYISIYW
eukprot:CAMPEP_0201590034 /NCGR_PEP_ID=MMETSP0190_2-20130828/173456_1 /ASSEMBLY_ACC=CAM_ASM_000263 /TAXON_ID=37353 /ORGANISM="Rosalina sp." /LENGTH=66 /DNA_ID=CAMNT_0048045359 /DNA_START=31 /DNA_END=228 /DNA_ORIENTATION=-